MSSSVAWDSAYAKVSLSFEEGKREISRVLHDGSALEKFYQMLMAQGVSPPDAKDMCYGQSSVMKVSRHQTEFKAGVGGTVTAIKAVNVAT